MHFISIILSDICTLTLAKDDDEIDNDSPPLESSKETESNTGGGNRNTGTSGRMSNNRAVGASRMANRKVGASRMGMASRASRMGTASRASRMGTASRMANANRKLVCNQVKREKMQSTFCIC